MQSWYNANRPIVFVDLDLGVNESKVVENDLIKETVVRLPPFSNFESILTLFAYNESSSIV